MGNGTIDFDSAAGVNRYMITLSAVASNQYGDPLRDAQQWRESLEIGSQYLYEATRGQVQIGKIELDLLQNGISHADVVLSDDGRRSWSSSGFLNRTRDCTAIRGPAFLRKFAMKYPMEVAHELAHIALGLADEYTRATNASPSVPHCTCDANSGASMMEFAANDDHSISLSVANGVVDTSSKPNKNVNEFCFPRTDTGNYRHGNSLVSTSISTLPATSHYINYQLKSSWEVMLDGFSRMTQKLKSDPVPSDRLPIQWTVATLRAQTIVSVFDVDGFAQRELLPGLAVSILGVAKLCVDSDRQFGLTKGLQLLHPLKFLRGNDLDPSLPGFDLREKIFGLGKAKGTPVENFGFDEFGRSSGVASHKRAILLVPGDGKLFEGEGEIVQQLRGRFEAIIPQLHKNMIDLTVVTVGKGPLSEAFTELDLNSPRWRHISVPVESGRFSGFHLQSVLSLLEFLDMPGMGVVGIKSGVFPAESARDFAGEPEAEDFLKPVDALLLHPQAEGIDFPVCIEHGANKARFVLGLGEHEDGLEYLLIDPLGNQVEGRRLNADDKLRIIELEEPTPGRWIVRVRRRVDVDPGKRIALPFQIFVGVENPSIHLTAEANVDGTEVEFTATTVVGSPLDHVNVIVEIYRLGDFGAGRPPLSSLVMRNEAIPATVGGESLIEIASGRQVASATLPPASDYVAVFTSRNLGAAVLANNTKGHPIGFGKAMKQEVVPAFERIQVRFFTVR